MNNPDALKTKPAPVDDDVMPETTRQTVGSPLTPDAHGHDPVGIVPKTDNLVSDAGGVGQKSYTAEVSEVDPNRGNNPVGRDA